MTKTVRLEAWAVEVPAYSAPEFGSRLRGIVFGHPNKRDGVQVVTSPVIKTFADRVVMTATGTRYRLGEPEPEYLAWCNKVGHLIDPIRPLGRVSKGRRGGKL